MTVARGGPFFSLLVLAGALSACASTTTVQGPLPQASMSVGQDGTPQTHVWVCHGGRNPKWKRIPVAAYDGHRGHGDSVSSSAHEKGQRCTR